MKREASNEDADPGEGPSKISKGEPQKDRLHYTSTIKSSNHGFEYQEEVAILLLLRATRRGIHFKLAYEMKDAGNFDDVVFFDHGTNENGETKKEEECLLFQVKHGEARKDEPVKLGMLFPGTADRRKDGDFSLFKYFESYFSNKLKLPNNKRFIIFTNRPLTKNIKHLLKNFTIDYDDLDRDDILYFFDTTEKPRRFTPTDEVAHKMMKYVNPVPAQLEAESLKNFFNHLALYFNQPELTKIIENELLSWMRQWIHPVDLGKTDQSKLLQCYAHLKDLLNRSSIKCNDKEKQKAFLTLKEGKTYLSNITFYLKDTMKVLNLRTTLAKVEDYYISRSVRITATTDDGEYDLCKLLTEKYAEEKIIVLTAKPGMGKSVLFYQVSQEIQRSSDGPVFLIYLNNLITNLEEIKQDITLETTLEIYENVLVACNRSIILAASKNENSNGQRIRMFLDGFDEIAPMHEHKVIQMIETLEKVNRIQIIVSGRRHVENKLKNKFIDAKYLYLMPFSKQNQKDFMKKRWKISAENESKFETYSTQILDEFDGLIDNSWCDFLGIPLMLNMFAEVKKTDFERFLSSNEAQYTGTLQSFSVVELYEEFIENSWKSKIDKLNQSHCYDYDSKIDFFQKHQLLAVDQLGYREICPLLDDPSMKTKLNEFKQNIKKDKERSPLVECVNDEIQFIHRSYAEYMVAAYLYDNIEKSVVLFESEEDDEDEPVIQKFFLDMIEEKGKLEHLGKIAKICEISCGLAVHKIIEEGYFKMVKFLITNNSTFVNNFYVSEPTSHELFKPIHFAVQFNHKKIVQILIEKGANINAQCSEENTPLHYAIEHIEMVQLLLDYSVNVNAQNRYGQTPLHKAIEDCQNDVAKMLIEHQIEENKITAVNLAAWFGKISILRPTLNKMVYQNYKDDSARNHLLSEDSKSYADVCIVELESLLENSPVDVNFEDFEGKTPLHYAAQAGQLDIVKLLLVKSTSINLQDNQGKTPLHYAARPEHHEIVKLLLDKIENANLQDFEGKTPLHYAAQAGHCQIVELLLNKTKHVDIKDSKGRTPLHDASEASHDQIVKLLLKKSAKVNVQKIATKDTPLHHAAGTGDLIIVELLLKKKEDVNVKGDEKRTPLHLAAQAGHHQIVKLLLQESADVNVQDYFEETPLHLAVENGHIKIVELLLEKSAEVDVQNSEGNTPLDLAEHRQMVELLIKETNKNIDEIWSYEQNSDVLSEKSVDVNTQDESTSTASTTSTEKAGRNQTNEFECLEKSNNENHEYLEGKTALHCAAEAGDYEIVNSMVNSENVLLYDNNGRIPLHYAVKSGQLQVVNLLMEKLVNVDLNAMFNKQLDRNSALDRVAEAVFGKSADLNLKDCRGQTVLHCAVKKNNQQIVELILEKTVDVNSQDTGGSTPLHYATIQGHLEIVKLLLVTKSCNISLKDSTGNTPLHHAARKKNLEIFQLLLRQPVDVNSKNNKEKTPLHYAAEAGSEEFVALLMEKSANIDLQDSEGKTPLHYAVAERSFNWKEGGARIIEMVQMLLRKPCDVNILDLSGKKPLHYAAKTDCPEIFALLMQESVDIDLQDSEGKTPLHYAVAERRESFNWKEGGARIIEMVQMLLRKPCDVNIQDLSGKTPLHIALLMTESVNIFERYIEGKTPIYNVVTKREYYYWKDKGAGIKNIIQLLLKKSCDVNIQDSSGKMPLHYAVETDCQEIIELLIERSVDINLKDSKGKTLLHYAVEKSKYVNWKEGGARIIEMVQMLLSKSCDVNIQDSNGKTPLHYAAETNYQEIIALLIEKSVDINLQDSNGKTPLHYAVAKSKYFNWKEGGARIIEMVQMLLRKPCDVNIQDLSGKTPLHIALLMTESVNIFKRYIEGKTPIYNVVTKREYYYWKDKGAGIKKIIQLLLKKSCDVNIQDSSGKMPLHYAVETDCQEIIELLIERSVDINLKDSKGKTLLHYAVEKSKYVNWKEGGARIIEMVQMLLSKSCDVNIQDSNGKTPLHYAAETNYQEIIALLIEKSVDINLQDSNGKTPLHYAVAKSKYFNWKEGGARIIEMVQMLLRKSFDVNLKDLNGKTPLHYAVETNYQEIIALLIEEPVEINLKDNDGKTPLHYVVAEREYYNWEDEGAGIKKIIQLLLSKSCDVNIQDSSKKTPLHYAAETDCQELIELLIEESVDINLIDSEGKTPLHYAVAKRKYFNWKEGGARIIEMVQMLLSKSCDVNIQDSNGKTPLHYAVAKRKYFNWKEGGARIKEMVQMLLSKSCDVNIQDSNGKTPLHYAAETDCQELIALLIEKSVDINLQDSNGKTPLHYAVAKSKYFNWKEGGARIIEMVQMLLRKSFDVNLKDLNGKTPLHYAVETNYQEIIALLIEEPVEINLKDNDGKTPLHYVVAEREYYNWEDEGAGIKKIIQLLLSKSCDVNIQDSSKKTPLHYAAETDCQELIELLIEESVDINLIDSEGKTPLHYAVAKRKYFNWKEGGARIIEMVQMLLSKSCDVNIQDSNGKTPLHYAVAKRKYFNWKEGGARIKEMVQMLLSKSCDVNIQDSNGKTPLHYAAETDCQELIALLIEESVDINLKDSEGKTPLHYAVAKRKYFNWKEGGARIIEMVQMLLRKSFDVNLKDLNGKTPLCYAAEAGCQEIIAKLMEKSVDNLQDNEGRTPLQYAHADPDSNPDPYADCILDLSTRVG